MTRVLLFPVLASLLFFGCDKSGGGSAPSDPEELGKKIAGDHQKMMDELADLLGQKQAPEALRPKLDALKAKYVALHVASGKQRETFSAELKQKCDGTIRSAMFKMNRDTLKILQESVKEIRKQDNDLANQVSSFNTLTQYASYELLKKQLPKEAERLGIK